MAGLIIVGVDGSAPATAAVEWAADDAARGGAALKIVHVHEPWANTVAFSGTAGAAEALTDHCRSLLAAAADRAHRRAPGVDISTDLATGSVVERLTSEAERADEIVIGSRGIGGFSGLVLGSVGLALAGHAAGPVVVVRTSASEVHDVVVVGFDGSEHSEAALEYAFAQARLRGARLRAIYAWQMPMLSPYALGSGRALEGIFQDEARTARQRLAPWREKYPQIEVEESALCDHPVPLLAEASRGADLVVVGSRGLGGFSSAMLGSVSHGVLHRAHCPVAVVRPRQEER